MAHVTSKLVRRTLDDPAIASVVQALDVVQLDALVRAVGLEDAGELLAMITREQFVGLVDEDLWEANGIREDFDHGRFVTWLEVMFEGGDELVVRRLRELPEETLVLAFSGQLLVLDSDTLGIGLAGASAREAELAEKALDACLYLELGNYTLVSRRPLGWDVVIAALLALDQHDHALTESVLEACALAHAEVLDDPGDLYALLTAEQTMAEDALADREQRRSARGFVARADAEAFLRGAASTPLDGSLPARDPITHAYFRELDVATLSTAAAAPLPDLGDLLEQLGLAPDTRPALPEPGHDRLRAALAALPPDLAAARQSELVYLANLLVASAHGYGPLAAAQQVLATCTRGLEHLSTHGHDASRLVADTGMDVLFRVGLAAGGPGSKSW